MAIEKDNDCRMLIYISYYTYKVGGRRRGSVATARTTTSCNGHIITVARGGEGRGSVASQKLPLEIPHQAMATFFLIQGYREGQ